MALRRRLYSKLESFPIELWLFQNEIFRCCFACKKESMGHSMDRITKFDLIIFQSSSDCSREIQTTARLNIEIFLIFLFNKSAVPYFFFKFIPYFIVFLTKNLVFPFSYVFESMLKIVYIFFNMKMYTHKLLLKEN